MSIYSTWDYVIGEGVKDGMKRGIAEGACRQWCKLLLRYGKRKFGPPTQEQRALLGMLADRVGLLQLETTMDRFLDASSWAELLAGITAPDAPPAPPDYLLPYQFDPSPMKPSIDEHFQATLFSGEPIIVHMRFQRLYQQDLGAILYRESQQLGEQHQCEVQTLVFLLWDGADGPAITGAYTIPSGGVFRYRVTRFWETDVDEVLCNAGTAAFAPLARSAPERLPEIVRRMDQVISVKAKDEKEKQVLWSVAYCCMGLRYPADRVNELLAHVLPIIFQSEDCLHMRSDGYYDGVSRGQEPGAVQATQRWVLTLGGRRLGEPAPDLRKAIESVRGLDRLEQLAARALKGARWQEVLAPG